MADLSPEQRLDRLERATAQLALKALDVQRADAARAKLNKRWTSAAHRDPHRLPRQWEHLSKTTEGTADADDRSR